VGKPRRLRKDEPTANVVRPTKQRRPHERDMSTGVAVMPDDDVKTKKKKKQKGKKKKVPPTKKVGRKKGKKKSKVLFYVLLALALPVIGGGVYLGFKIRELRLDRRITAVERNAAALEKKDTYGVYLRARDEYKRIVDARSNAATRAAFARMQAAIAAEFGEELDEASTAVDALGDYDSADAAVARAYLAIAKSDPAAAKEHVGHLEKTYPDEPFAGYLRGRVAMLSGDAQAAAEHFRSALGPTQQRPVVYIRLGEAEVESKQLNEAKFRFAHVIEVVPGHPAAIIARARLMSRGELPAEGDPENALEGLIAEGKKAASEQELGVAPKQIAWANLALAEVKLAREKPEDAKAALSNAQAARPTNDLQFSETLIDILLRVGQMKAAEDEARHTVSKWPERVGPRVVLAQVALERDRPQEVIEALKDVADLSEYPEALAVRGRAHLALGDIKAAKEDLDAALTAQPGHADALLARAEVDLKEGQTAAVVKRLKDMYNDSADPALGIIYASALRREGERGKARGILQMLVKQPDSGKAQLELARLERDEGNYKAARAAYSEAIKKLPSGVDARLEAALLALDTGDVSGAKETMVKLVDDFADSGRVLVEAARIYAMTGALDEANKLLDKAQDISSAPRWRIARERGRVHLRRREASAAVTELSRAVSLKSDDGETRLLLIDAHLASENSGAARSTKDDVLNRRESFEGLWVSQMAVGRWNLYNDLLGEALKAFSEAKKILTKEKASPRLMASTHYWIGRVYYYDDKLKASQKQLEKAVKLNPAHFDAHLFLGLVHYDAKRWRTAAKSFQASVDLQPESNPATYFYMGECWYNAKNWRASKKAFKKYVKLDPSGDLVREAKGYIRRMGG
jgi:tetratricopeptide (TPR) repeat protein